MLKTLNRSTISAAPVRPIKVLQFGGGNFLRGFADWIIDVMNERTDFNGSVQIIQSVSNDTSLNDQEGLYHVVVNGLRNNKPVSEIRLVTCVTGALSGDKDFSGFLRLAENPDLEFIISNTTEAGITVNENDKSISSLSVTFPGKLTQLLNHRFHFFKGGKPLIIIPCELISCNGDELKRAVLRYAELWNLSKEFREWLNKNIFCNTLVDRIVPGSPKENLQEVKEKIGYDDKLIVTAEPFHLWVIEGPDQVKQRFPADKAGLEVKFVKDHEPYRVRKVRILNGAHTALVPVAYLYGLRTVRESIENDFTGSFIKKVIYNEIIPTLDLPPEELKQFADDVIQRFQNPYIKHELSSIALNSISKFKIRIVPTILEHHLRKKQLPKRLIFSMAAMIRFYKGEWNELPLPLQDAPDVAEFFRTAWQDKNLNSVASKVLANTLLWGLDLSKIEGLTDLITEYLTNIEERAFVKAESITYP